jgi:hypothetical protein
MLARILSIDALQKPYAANDDQDRAPMAFKASRTFITAQESGLRL